jgi:hypothetical protein
VRAWQQGATNHGWGIIPWVGGTDGWIFFDSENATVTNRPMLTVEWDVAPNAQQVRFQQGV